MDLTLKPHRQKETVLNIGRRTEHGDALQVPRDECGRGRRYGSRDIEASGENLE